MSSFDHSRDVIWKVIEVVSNEEHYKIIFFFCQSHCHGQMYIKLILSNDSIRLMYKHIFIKILTSVMDSLVEALVFDSRGAGSSLNKDILLNWFFFNLQLMPHGIFFIKNQFTFFSLSSPFSELHPIILQNPYHRTCRS